MGGLMLNADLAGVDGLKAKLASTVTRAENILAIQIAKDTQPFVPMTNGGLVNQTQVKNNVIFYPGPYARFLYYGKVMIDPDTGSAWAKLGKTKVTTDKNLVFNTAVHPQAQDHWFEASKAQNLDKWIRVAGRAIAYGDNKGR